MHLKKLAPAFVLLALASCSSPSRYEPTNGQNGSGYSDERLAENRYRVTFSGNSATRRETVENFLMLRAAEVTRAAGYSWFVFDERDTEAKTTYHSNFVGYPGWDLGWSRFGWYGRSWPYDPWDPYWDSHQVVTPSTRYQAYAEIVLLPADAAKADPHAMSALDVISRLGSASIQPSVH